MIDIHLYLGAHKTATTHLQGILLANRDTLLTENVTISAPQDVRKRWLPEFFNYNKNRKHTVDKNLINRLTSIAPATGLWILTEENIIGVSNDFKNRAGIYPATGTRLKSLVSLFGNANIKLFFSVRSYASFYRSAYSEVVRNRGYLPFDEFYDATRYKNNSWIDTVRMFQEAIPQDHITLWKFEDFRLLVPHLIHLISGGHNAEALLTRYSPKTTRPSLSQKTIDILSDLSPVLRRDESLHLVERINAAYPVGNGCEPYQPFTSKQKSVFQEQYDTDIEEIKKRFSAIRFVEPQGDK